MLNGYDNANDKKNYTIGLISKRKTLHMLDTFLYISLLLFCTTTSSNFQYLPTVTRFIE